MEESPSGAGSHKRTRPVEAAGAADAQTRPPRLGKHCAFSPSFHRALPHHKHTQRKTRKSTGHWASWSPFSQFRTHMNFRRAGKAGGFGIRTHHPIAGVTTSESLEAPATRRRITLQVLVHHAQHLACTHGDRVVRAHRSNAEGTRPGHVVCEGDGILLLLTRRRIAGENGTGMVKTVGYAFPETAASAGRRGLRPPRPSIGIRSCGRFGHPQACRGAADQHVS